MSGLDLMWGNQFDDAGDENEEEDDHTSWRTTKRDGLIFLIDCTEPMFLKNGDCDEESPFELCIKCAKNVMQNKIISSDKDLMGIVFFGSKSIKNSSDFKHIYVLQDLEQPSAERVLQLEEIMNNENKDFKTKFGHDDGFSMSDALWTCSNMFSTSSLGLGYKRVLLFTNNDNPHASDPSLKRQATRKAKDLFETGIQLELMHIQMPGQKFDISLFYNDCLFNDEDEITNPPDPAKKFEELLTRVRSKDHKKRTTGKIPFCLGKELDMSVGVYSIIRTCTKPSSVKLFKRTNEEVKSNTKSFVSETCEILMPQDLKKAAIYGGKKICFEKEEIAEMKSFGKTGLNLMGFKPQSYLKRYHHIESAKFIYPEETVIKGSTNLFSALLQKCIEREVIAVCTFIPRKNAYPKFVALLPQSEELNDERVQCTPSGFHVIVLPFADDLRNLKYEETVKANTEQIEKAKEVIKKLSFRFFSDHFENPSLQKHYANLEALALERDEPEPIQDFTIPNYEQMKKRAGSVLKEFEELVFPEGYNAFKGKRKATTSASASKRAKKDENDDGVKLDIEVEARAGRLTKVTVPVLKECVNELKIKVKGSKKADLISAINKHFGI